MKPETTEGNWAIQEYVDNEEHTTDSQANQRRTPKESKNVSYNK